MSEDSAVTEFMDTEAAYNSDLGSAFQGDSRELLEQLPDNSIDLIVTSPPFALQH
jgi:site-specific DNA-methyltransferase (cytosine-N4-specific)